VELCAAWMHWHTNAMMNRSFMTVSLFIV